MAVVLGLTGGIASGKSTVSKLFQKKGFSIIDADIASRVVVEPGKDAYHRIIEVFGESILQEDRTIHRSKLGSIIFSDEEKRNLLNQIVHPAVRAQMNKWRDEAISTGKQTIIYDIPLLYESHLTYLVEKVIVVYVNETIQLQRLMERNQLAEQEAMARIQSQMPLDEKVALADAVIDNNGTLEETAAQLEQIITSWSLQI